MVYFHQIQYRQIKEQIISFSRKKPRSCNISKANAFKLTSKQFLFSKCKLKISRFILNKYSFTKLKMGKMRKWSLKKPLFGRVCWQSTHKGNDQYKGATLYLEEKNWSDLENEMNISYNKTRGHLVYKRLIDPFSKWQWMFLKVRRGLMNDPLKLFGETKNL